MKCIDVDGVVTPWATRALGFFQQLSNQPLSNRPLSGKQLRAKLLSVTLLNTALLMSGGAQAADISPAMLLQAQSMSQSMSAAEQEKLAKQFGFDRSMITGKTEAETALGLPGEPLEQDSQVESRRKRPSMKAMKDKDAQVSRFGEDLFDQEVSSFSVTDNALVPKDYRLGTGDEVQIIFYGKETDNYVLEIGRDGVVQLPKVGPLVLAGLQFEDARDLIQRQVQERIIGVEAVVSMGRMRAISVFMAGEVRVPGSYSVSALSTVSQALFVAGGVSPIGTLRNIQVKRAGRTIAKFDTYDLLLRGETDQDVRLESGDVVFVPPYDRLAVIEGEVKRPMAYELADSETAANLVAMAGGYARDAYPAAAVLLRKAQGKNLPTVVNVDLVENLAAFKLYDGDTLRIPQSAETYKNAIEIKGAAVRPGVYGWVDGLRVSDLLPSVSGDLLPTVDVNYALIVREKNQRLDIAVNSFNLGDAILHPGSDMDPLLAARDQLIIFNLVDLAGLTAAERGILSTENDETQAEKLDRNSDGYTDSESDQALALTLTRQVLLAPILNKLRSQARQGEPVEIVSVSGAVKAPGDYPLEAGDRVYDLLLAAGGLQDSVYLPAAELRRIVNQVGGAVESDYQELSLEYTDDIDSVNNLLLQSRDHLMVRTIPDWNPVEMVEISGEVRFPGSYLIRRGETLSQIVARAGGLTPDAFPQGAVFTREAIAKLEAERAVEFANSIRNSFAASLLTQELKSTDFSEIETITQTLTDFKGNGRMLINLDSALTGDATADLVVVTGDKLLIPTKTSTITVVGEVRRQGTHSFARNLEVKDYLNLSAGMTARADKKEVYIVKADGSVVIPQTSWVSFGGGQQRLAPGDSIVVPIDGTYKDNITQWRDVTQILYQSAITMAAVIAL